MTFLLAIVFRVLPTLLAELFKFALQRFNDANIQIKGNPDLKEKVGKTLQDLAMEVVLSVEYEANQYERRTGAKWAGSFKLQEAYWRIQSRALAAGKIFAVSAVNLAVETVVNALNAKADEPVVRDATPTELDNWKSGLHDA